LEPCGWDSEAATAFVEQLIKMTDADSKKDTNQAATEAASPDPMAAGKVVVESTELAQTLIPKSDLLQFVEKMGKRYDDYHGRKESASWLALVLYMAIAFQVAAFGAEGFQVKVILTLWQVVVAVTFFRYIREQIGNRAIASYVSSGCYQLEAILLADARSELPRAEYSLELANEGDRQVDFILPEFIRLKADEFRIKGGRPGRIMDFSRYTIFAMSTILAFIGIWSE